MSETARQFAAELQRLCRHQGMRAPKLAARCGPLLAELADLPHDASDLEARQRIQLLVDRLTVDCTRDEVRLVRCALASGDERMPAKLSERIGRVAGEIGYAQRTVRRRLAEVLGELGRVAAARRACEGGEHGHWYLRRLDAVLRLDGPQVRLTERRTIVARSDCLDRVTTRFSVPPAAAAAAAAAALGPQDLLVEIGYGAVLRKSRRLSDAMFEFDIELPTALGRGGEHEYEISFTLPAGWPIQPHYALVPRVECDLFQMKVRFDPERPPASVVRLDGIEYQELAGRCAPGPSVRLDPLGEAKLTFEHLVKRCMYGIEWLPGAGR
jgi:hypothetical protein